MSPLQRQDPRFPQHQHPQVCPSFLTAYPKLPWPCAGRPQEFQDSSRPARPAPFRGAGSRQIELAELSELIQLAQTARQLEQHC